MLFVSTGPCELSGYTDSCCDNTLSDCQGQTDVGVCHCDEECEIHGDCCVDFDIICKYVHCDMYQWHISYSRH